MIEQGNGVSEIQQDVNDEELEDLKIQFIVNGNEINKEILKKHVKTILDFCKLTSEGKVILRKTKLTQKNQIGIIIMARYLENKMNENIKETISPGELADLTSIARNNVRSLVGTLADERFVTRVEEGIYRFNPTQIELFFEKIK